MNAGLVTLQDGTPCIVYDEQLPYPIKHVEFCRDDFQVMLVYQLPDDKAPRDGVKFDFPLDHAFVEMLEKNKKVAVGFVKEQQLAEIKMYYVVFTDS